MTPAELFRGGIVRRLRNNWTQNDSAPPATSASGLVTPGRTLLGHLLSRCLLQSHQAQFRKRPPDVSCTVPIGERG